MIQYCDMLSHSPVGYELSNMIKQLRESHLKSGGDPVDFPDFLANLGISVVGSMIKLDENAQSLLSILQD